MILFKLSREKKQKTPAIKKCKWVWRQSAPKQLSIAEDNRTKSKARVFVFCKLLLKKNMKHQNVFQDEGTKEPSPWQSP